MYKEQEEIIPDINTYEYYKIKDGNRPRCLCFIKNLKDIQQSVPYDEFDNITINLPELGLQRQQADKMNLILSKYNMCIEKSRGTTCTYIISTKEHHTIDDIKNFKNANIIHDDSKKPLEFQNQIDGYSPFDEVINEYKNTQIFDDNDDLPSASIMKRDTDDIILSYARKIIIDGIKAASKNGKYEFMYEGLIPDSFVEALKGKGYTVTIKPKFLQVIISWK